MRKRWPVDGIARRVLDGRLGEPKLSARAADRVLALAWSVADLCGHDQPGRGDTVLALALRQGMPLGPDLRELVAAS